MPRLPRPRESERRARGLRRVGSRERVSKPLVVESQDDESRKKDHAVTFPGHLRQQGRARPVERSTGVKVVAKVLDRHPIVRSSERETA